MIVVICAAGSGTRIKELTSRKLKLLLKINGKTLLERVLDNVAQNGVSKIIIVVGKNSEPIREAIGTQYNGIKVIYIFNEYYYTKGNMSSLWAAREYISEDLVFTVGDIIISKSNVNRIFNSPYDASILVDTSEKAKQQDDVLKILVKNGRIKGIKKKIEEAKIFGSACGFYNFRLEVAKKFYGIIGDHFRRGEYDLPFNVPIGELCKAHEVFPVESDGSFCMDIDTPEDLRRAIEELKKIER